MQGIDSCVVFCKYLPAQVLIKIPNSYRKSTPIYCPISRNTLRTKAGGLDTLSQIALWTSLKASALTKPESICFPTTAASSRIPNQRSVLQQLAGSPISAASSMHLASSRRLFHASRSYRWILSSTCVAHSLRTFSRYAPSLRRQQPTSTFFRCSWLF